MSVVTVVAGLAGKRKLGWKRNAPDEDDLVLNASALMTRATRSPIFTLEAFVPGVYNQGATGSCVAQAIAAAIGIRESAAGLPYETARDGISRRALYLLSRYSHGDHKEDGGTYIRSALSIMRKHGCPLESAFPWSQLKINQVPPATAIAGGYERSGLTYEAIVAAGDAKLEQVQLAIGARLPVVFGVMLPESFGSHRGADIYHPRATERRIGGHAMVIVGTRADGCVRILNSWGRGWGDGGLAWVSPEWAASAFRDLTVMHGWKRERETKVRSAA